ncbi:MAG: DUF4293 domain-containing protein [Cyclobacteriaceae bacterium]|nr:DUF4293 domain-containing protein [Cyclobacteriaceae bacterium]
MIQRVQSLFLLGVAVCLITMLFFPIWEKVDLEAQTSTTLKAYVAEVVTSGEQSEVFYFPAAIVGFLAIVGAVIALFELFQYRSRLNQIKLGALNSLVMAGIMGVCVYLTFRFEQNIAGNGQGEYQMGMYLPAVALILNLLANRFIRRDESLVRSVDRLR